jgi:hypothetical protein
MEPQRYHERVPDCGPFAKYAAAFDKKLRSIFNSATSRLSRVASTCSSVSGFVLLPTRARTPTLSALTQQVIVEQSLGNLRCFHATLGDHLYCFFPKLS